MDAVGIQRQIDFTSRGYGSQRVGSNRLGFRDITCHSLQPDDSRRLICGDTVQGRRVWTARRHLTNGKPDRILEVHFFSCRCCLCRERIHTVGRERQIDFTHRRNCSQSIGCNRLGFGDVTCPLQSDDPRRLIRSDTVESGSEWPTRRHLTNLKRNPVLEVHFLTCRRRLCRERVHTVRRKR